MSSLFYFFFTSILGYLLSADSQLIGVLLGWRKTSPNWAPIAGFRSGNSLKIHPVPECENKCLNLALFTKIRLNLA